MAKYKWQGEPVKVEFGYCEVTENKEKPLFWYNFECNWDTHTDNQIRSANPVKSAIVPAIKVTYQDREFCIANHFAIGAHKLKNGGWPNYTHFSLPKETFSKAVYKTEGLVFCLRRFDLEGYEKHEAKRRKWQKANFPQEFEKIATLKQHLKKITQ